MEKSLKNPRGPPKKERMRPDLSNRNTKRYSNRIDPHQARRRRFISLTHRQPNTPEHQPRKGSRPKEQLTIRTAEKEENSREYPQDSPKRQAPRRPSKKKAPKDRGNRRKAAPQVKNQEEKRNPDSQGSTKRRKGNHRGGSETRRESADIIALIPNRRPPRREISIVRGNGAEIKEPARLSCYDKNYQDCVTDNQVTSAGLVTNNQATEETYAGTETNKEQGGDLRTRRGKQELAGGKTETEGVGGEKVTRQGKDRKKEQAGNPRVEGGTEGRKDKHQTERIQILSEVT
ncbi:hypothetical protein C922_05088 [Plasmodium inui San Antonio 1]|uniref:Uncharacterized protein n=1 Tax=Plasmodium inui San Antonio 1 TaxID=1237626 RepID=W7AGY0_9APIC|nr:hypothetical protein C922_05088 [Plasmodium inui San Antonio 1]EUD64526.1 hypothetical protein C922_05088 [Plasmodium inui San Antonio 1]